MNLDIIRLFFKITLKYCEFDGSKVSKTPLVHTYASQSIQTTITTQARKNHGMGTILGGAPIRFLLNGFRSQTNYQPIAKPSDPY